MHEFTNDQSYIFDYTLAELQAFDVGEGERVPTLGQVFEILGSEVYINIEVKVPYEMKVKKMYNYSRSAKKLYKLVKAHGLQQTCCISSFDQDILV